MTSQEFLTGTSVLKTLHLLWDASGCYSNRHPSSIPLGFFLGFYLHCCLFPLGFLCLRLADLEIHFLSGTIYAQCSLFSPPFLSLCISWSGSLSCVGIEEGEIIISWFEKELKAPLPGSRALFLCWLIARQADLF